MDFTGKRILVTGGTRGIGRGIVEAFRKAGASVAVNGTTAGTTARAIQELEDDGRTVAAPGSVSTVEGCQAIVDAAVRGLGGLDVLVNNAGVLTPCQSLVDATEAHWNAIIDTNLKGVFFTTKFAAPYLRAAKGSIVNIASISGISGSSFPIYGASKAAVIHLTRSHALELGPDIRVNSVCPGPIETDMLQAAMIETDGDLESGRRNWTEGVSALKRIGVIREIVGSVLFLASDLASFTTGTALVVDGGASIG